MHCDADDFKLGMRQLAAGVTVITSSLDGERTGMTATAVCAVSASPPRLLACVNLRGATYRLISASRRRFSAMPPPSSSARSNKCW